MEVLNRSAVPHAAAHCGRTILATWLLLACLVGWCHAASTAPAIYGVRTGAGVTMTVESDWVDGPGYRPMTITVTPTLPNVADRTLTVELVLRGIYSRDYDLRMTQDIEIPAGSGPVQAAVSIPRQVAWSSIELNVVEDGQLLKPLSGPLGGVAMAMRFAECLPLILIAGDELPNMNLWSTILPLHEYQNLSITPMQTGDGGAIVYPGAISRALGKFPRRWIDYTSLDIVCLSLEQLGRLDARQREAVLAWTAAGGNLWVYGVGEKWERLDRLADLVVMPARKGDPARHGWEPPAQKIYDYQRQLAEQARAIQYGIPNQAVGEASLPDTAAKETPDPAKFGKPHFLLRSCGMGQIAAFGLDNLFPGDAGQWQWVFGAVGMDRLLWYQRHGMSMGRGNPDFWNFLIPGVGLAPVTEFCILITVFVLAIGPLNYWLLRRWKRLHLLVVTIPVCAAAVTLFLFGYALIADGLSTRVRVRSITQIDQRRKQAACWARLSYYAGMSLGGGLTFPADTAVLPLEYQPKQNYYQPPAPQRRDMVWEADQRLTSGWLAPRTPTQYLTLHSRPTDRGLDLIGAEGNTGEAKRPLQVRNRLGTHIEQLVVWPDRGQGRYWAENVAADAVATLQPIGPAEAMNRLRVVYFANQTVPPDGMAGFRSGIFGVSRGFSYSYGYYGGNSPTVLLPSQAAGLLERSLRSVGGPSGSAEEDLDVFEPGSYVAIVGRSPEVALGNDAAREEASYHVIVGKW